AKEMVGESENMEERMAGNCHIDQKETPCVLEIQEIKCGKVKEQWVEDLWGSRNFGYAQVKAKGKSGGLLLVWDTNIFSASQSVGDERFIAVKGSWKGRDGDLILANVYGPHPSNEKGVLWSRLEGLIQQNNCAWCVFGDFNEVRNQDDRMNTQFHTKDSDEFNEFIANTQLMEVPMGGRRFTRISDDGGKFSKLDRFLITEDFRKKWGNLAAVALDQKLSD
ncbi:RNA-directed DNA polymerase, eukaryota, partial [Tanacetum coccineum]